MSTVLDSRPWDPDSSPLTDVSDASPDLPSYTSRPTSHVRGNHDNTKERGEYSHAGVCGTALSIHEAKAREQAVPRHHLSNLLNPVEPEVAVRPADVGPTIHHSPPPARNQSPPPANEQSLAPPPKAEAGPGPQSKKSSRFYEYIVVDKTEKPPASPPPLGRTRFRASLANQEAQGSTEEALQKRTTRPKRPKRPEPGSGFDSDGTPSASKDLGDVERKRKRLHSPPVEIRPSSPMDQVEVVKRIELGNKSAFSKDMSARTVSPELTTPSSQSEYEEPGQRSKQIKPSKKHQKPLDPEQPPAPKRVKRKRKLRRNSDSDFEAEVARPTKRKPTGVLTPDSAEAGPEAANSKDHTVIRHSQSSTPSTISSESPQRPPKKRRKAVDNKAVSTTPKRPLNRPAAVFERSCLGQTTEVQQAACLNPRYRDYAQCTQCIRRQGGDVCRFRLFRVFPTDPATGRLNGKPYFKSQSRVQANVPRLRQLHSHFGLPEISKTKAAIIPVMLPVITSELRYVVANNAMYRDIGEEHRALCDFCSSTVFGGSWFCLGCGREYCSSCYELFPATASDEDIARVDLQPEAVQRILRCRFRGPPHTRVNLRAVSRFERAQLEEHWLAMVTTALEARLDVVDALAKDLPIKSLEEAFEAQYQPLAQQDVVYPDLYTLSTSTCPPPGDPAGLAEQSHPFMRCANAESLSNDLFDQLWSRGEPIVVDNCLEALSLDWSPSGFIERYGSQSCAIVNCQTNEMVIKTVGSFFASFGEKQRNVMKLKDWPPTSDFQESFPDLYDDFNRALPVPDYTRRDGVLNLSAHFPDGPSRPDLGPKMYNAYRAREDKGGHGSTRLHMDIADAINIMVYASDQNSLPGCAVWDIFKAEDADRIRTFLTDKFRSQHSFTDPIHSQLFYLNSQLRKELFESTGVVSWRIYQYPGQAVFIPAGCAHQVCNLADCIKIAMDFVSPHNVKRCQELTNDFRKENFARVWKDDVLQLYNVLWYAWLSSRAAEMQAKGLAQGADNDVTMVEDTSTPTDTDSLAKRLLAITITHFESLRDGGELAPKAEISPKAAAAEQLCAASTSLDSPEPVGTSLPVLEASRPASPTTPQPVASSPPRSALESSEPVEEKLVPSAELEAEAPRVHQEIIAESSPSVPPPASATPETRTENVGPVITAGLEPLTDVPSDDTVKSVTPSFVPLFESLPSTLPTPQPILLDDARELSPDSCDETPDSSGASNGEWSDFREARPAPACDPLESPEAELDPALDAVAPIQVPHAAPVITPVPAGSPPSLAIHPLLAGKKLFEW